MPNPRRKSLRLADFDYSQPGAYFITIKIQNRRNLLGEVMGGVMRLNEAGKMVEKWWHDLPRKFPVAHADVFVIMPNHVHGIIFVVGADLCVRPNNTSEMPDGTQKGRGAHTGAPLQRMVQWFKTMTTNAYLQGIKQSGWEPINGKMWQRSFYDHIIRDEASLHRIREYIINNPLTWELDRENPGLRKENEFYGWLENFKTRPQSQGR